jgi:hypothetical protein
VESWRREEGYEHSEESGRDWEKLLLDVMVSIWVVSPKSHI